jgi:thiosulfate/3-mercaptopyruvate sulfurtransferase
MGAYVHPEVLVSTHWVFEHGKDPKVKLVEVDVDTTAYDQGHIEGAVGWNWQLQLQDGVRRDLIDRREFEQLLGESGISNEDTVIVYGDNNNWFAAWAFWQLKLYGHRDARIMNGGRKKWLEEKRPVTTAAAKIVPTQYRAQEPEATIRATRELIFAVLDGRHNAHLVDVRSPDEFTGKIVAPPGMTETAQRGGHIPGAKNIPWSLAVREDGTFKPAEELRELYNARGVLPNQEAIAYCRIGERSSHTWFVLKYLLGFEKVRNYDGSWTEWGNLVGAPIEKGAAAAAT